MNAPPEHEDIRPWLAVCERLATIGLGVPQVFAADVERGFVLMSDLGSRHYLDELSESSVERLYQQAMRALLDMQRNVDVTGLPRYDESRLQLELNLFPEWFMARHLRHTMSAEEERLWRQCCAHLLASAVEQPQYFVHRDFHSRNLLCAEPTPGIIDFQDAVHGPLTYDLVSLLRDCYIRWQPERVSQWCEQFRLEAKAAGLVDVGPTRFRRWFDWMGLQRHLKVLGIFARLNYRDGKSGYLRDLPLVLRYVLEVCDRYGDLATFGQWLERCTRGVELTRSRD